MRILQVNTRDMGGGAEKMVWGLHQAYQERGHDSRLAVGYQSAPGTQSTTIPNARASRGWTAFWWRNYERLQASPGRARWNRLLVGATHRLAEPLSWFEHVRGLDDFSFPGTRILPDVNAGRFDILHCHNLHGDYFDLRAMPGLSQTLPVVVTPHDAWLLSGHCAHSLDCQRWQTGCGACPDLSLYPAVRKDNTARNWSVKRDIYQRCRFYVTTQSRWLMAKVERSMLAPAVAASKVIPTGIDLNTFRPADKRMARLALNLPEAAQVLLFTANKARRNSYKDYATVQLAANCVAGMFPDRHTIFLVLGEAGESQETGLAEVRHVSFLKDSAVVARYYQAADVYVHGARADTFPQAVLEALACGTPVVANAVGGIPEQIVDGVTGFLSPVGDPQAMANAIFRILSDRGLMARISNEAARWAQQNYSSDRQTDDYLEFYQQAISHFATRRITQPDA
jgi:glycosyltransferase involved in cell wall biosynthesis